MRELLHGDCRDILPSLPEQSVQCVVTSRPTFKRDSKTQFARRKARRHIVQQQDDLTGKTFGQLHVIQKADDIIHRNAFWVCECKCGGVVYVSGTNLRRSYTTRCKGCAAQDGEHSET